MGLIDGLFGLVGSVINAGANVASTEITNNANKELAQYSYEQQQAMIDKQNAYNSPAQQIARYQAAGLNPNLIYGQISNGNQSQIAKYEAPTMQAPKVTNLLGDIFDVLAKAQSVKNLAEEGRSKELRNEAQKLNNTLSSSLLNDRIARYQLDMDMIRMRQHNLALNSDILEWRKKNLLPEQLFQMKFQNNALNPLKQSLLNQQIKALGLDIQGKRLSNDYQAKINNYQDANQVIGIIDKVLGGFVKTLIPFKLIK